MNIKSKICVDSYRNGSTPKTIKTLLADIYGTPENSEIPTMKRVSKDTVIQLLIDNDYITGAHSGGYIETAKGRKYGFNSDQLYGKWYVICDHQARNIVINLILEFIESTQPEEKEPIIPGPCIPKEGDEFASNIIKNITKHYPNMKEVRDEFYSYLMQQGILRESNEDENTTYLRVPTDLAREYGIRMTTFSSPDSDITLQYIVYSSMGQQLVYDHFNQLANLSTR